MKKSFVLGVGMNKFTKPGTHEPYEVMASKAIKAALDDAGMELPQIQQAFASYVYGDSTCGQKAFYELGFTGIPIFNVNNNCASGSSAIFLARQAVESGAVDCALAFGFEAMQPGALKMAWDDRTPPGKDILDALKQVRPQVIAGPPALMLFGSAGFEYLETYNAKPELFAEIAVKTRAHAINNPMSLFSKPLTVEDVMSSDVVYGDSLHKLMCCPPTCGAAAAIIVSEATARKYDKGQAVEIAGQGMSSDSEALFEHARNVAGQDQTRRAANIAYEMAGICPDDVDVVELHDCFTPNEVVSYEGLNLCAEGESSKFVADGDNTYGGKYVVNPSGGLMSKGHPLGATGLAQCSELIWQLRGQADKRQVDGARIALQHNIGIPGGAVVTIYKKTGFSA